jgi:two-component system, NtrC family, sensor kinase
MSSDMIAAILREIAEARIPRDVPDACENADEVRKLVGFLRDVQRALRLLSEGDLAFEVEQRGPFAGSIKALQASLRHLTWQTVRVAEGDFDQRVDFMGEFAASFNTMVEKLKSSRDIIIQRNSDLELAYEKLKESQAQLLQHEKLASIGQLAAGIAHEINNPLAFVYTNLNRFDEYYHDVVSLLRSWQEFGREVEGMPAFQKRIAYLREEEQKTGLDFIEEDFPKLMGHSRDGAVRIQSIVAQMRGFADTGKMPLQVCEIRQIVDEALADPGLELRPGIAVLKDYGDAARVSCRPGEMKMVLVHLVRNAIHSIPSDGEIRICTSMHDAAVRITIKDTGCGIPPENLTRIFDPFFTTKPVGKGVGLGLWVVSTVVHSAQGTVEVASDVGKGTTVTLTFPFVSPR